MTGYRFLQSRWLLLLVPLFLIGCNSGGGGGGGGGGGLAGVVAEADGFAQKGPFQVGGTARIQPLADDGTTAGEGIETDIGQAGEFNFEGIDWSGPSLITVTGDWFSESVGNFAGQPLTLRSVVAIPAPDDDDAESPFPTSVNLLTEAMTDLVLTRLADDRNFNGSVNTANNRLNEVLDFEGDVRDLNLFALDSQHLRDRQVSGVFAKIMIALSARDDIADIIEMAGSSAWDGNSVDDTFADLLQELRNEAAEMLGDGGIETARTLLENNYGGVELSRQLTNQGVLGMTVACNPNEVDEFGNERMCIGVPRVVELEQNESRIFWFEAPHDGAFRFNTGTTSKSLSVHQSINDSGALGTQLENCPVPCSQAVATEILTEGTIRYFRVQSANFGGPRVFENVTVARMNAGAPDNPRWIFPDVTITAANVNQNFTLRTGSRLGSAGVDSAPITNDHSYVRFMLPAGITRVGVNHAPCEVTQSSSSVFLYRTPGGVPTSEVFVDPDRLVDQRTGNDCTLNLDIDAPSQGEYLLKIVNRRNNVSGFQAPSGSFRSYHVFAD